MRLPNPVDLLRLPAHVSGAIETAVALVPRLAILVRDLDLLVRDARSVTLEAKAVVLATEATQRQVAAVVVAAESTRVDTQNLVSRVTATEAAAAAAVREIRALAERVDDVLSRFEPSLQQLAPVADRLAEGLRPEDADAVVEIIHQAPQIVDTVTEQVLPVLDSLDTVAPDLREVLDVSQDLEEMLGAVPGLGRVRKRVEAQKRREREGRA